MSVRILTGDVRAVLPTLPSESVNCVVCSPPYWGLRSYLPDGHDDKPKEIGLEPTVADHIAALTETFREVRRVLRKDGTLWLNYGDAYTSGDRATYRSGASDNKGQRVQDDMPRPRTPNGLKPKDLIGLPWRLAFALQADGWWLRSDIIWAKPNPMPESVTDRPTRAHEYVFLLTKSARYYYDANAILEPASESTHARLSQDVQAQIGSERANGGTTTNGPMKAVARAIKMDESQDRRKQGFNQRWDERERNVGIGSNARPRKAAPNGSGTKNNSSFDEAMAIMPLMRNKRSVWTIGTEPFSEAHFAVFPTALVEPCIKAGCPAGGTVLDPFGGAGTVGLVADRLQRDAILIELNPTYAEMARARIERDAPLFAELAP